VKIATNTHLKGVTRAAGRAIAKLVKSMTFVQDTNTRRAMRWTSAVNMEIVNSSEVSCDDKPRLAGTDDLIRAFGSCEPVEAHGGVFGYKDQAGVRHPLF